MQTILLDGKKVADFRLEQLKPQIQDFAAKFGRAPHLSVVIVGDDPASHVYVGNKEKACQKIGLGSSVIKLAADTSEKELLDCVSKLNRDENIDAMLVQMPIPKQIQTDVILDAISPQKDADGLTAVNMGLLWVGRPRVSPCTPFGVMKILEYYKINLKSLNVAVIGRSQIVGKPMAHLLSQAQATVTICHSQTKDLQKITQSSDLVVVAAGKPRNWGKADFKQGGVVVDVGIHRVDGKICGDVRSEELQGWSQAVTPVPGGVGPLTISSLLENTVKLAFLRKKSL